MGPKRIISLVPSQTELLFDLGLDDEIVGLTKFCIYPADKVKDKAIVGGTKALHIDRIHTLQPDLIIANKEENDREQIELLRRHYPVHVTDIITLADALTMIREVGNLVGKREQTEKMTRQIDTMLSCSPLDQPLRIAYFIWRKPYMVAANDTFIHAMLTAAGFVNAFADQTRYPVITPEALQAARPDLLFLSSEPYPFTQKHRGELQAICPFAQVMLVDGEVFSWYGSRLLQASDYFRKLRTQIARLSS